MSKKKWIPALSVKDSEINILIGDKIKIYGKETTVTGFYFSFNEGLMKWETIILTTGRGDPLERSLDVIEINENKPDNTPYSPQPIPLSDGPGGEQCCCLERVGENAGCVFPRCMPYANQNASKRATPSPQTAEGEIPKRKTPEEIFEANRPLYGQWGNLKAMCVASIKQYADQELSSALSRIADLEEKLLQEIEKNRELSEWVASHK